MNEDIEPGFPDFLQPYVDQLKAKIPVVRIDQSRSDVSLPSQQTDHLVVNHNGVVVARDGEPISGGVKSDPVNAHIPLEIWLAREHWFTPGAEA